MVNRQNFTHGEAPYRRPNCRGPPDGNDGYQTHNERQMERNFPTVPSQELRHNNRNSNNKGPNPVPSQEPRVRNNQGVNKTAEPKKRVSVACVRCRRRKIKCSGDGGIGLSCESCKILHLDDCQFVRVSSVSSDFGSVFASQSLPPPDFPYGEDSQLSSQARLMPPVSYNHVQYPQVVNSMTHGGTTFRTTSVSNLQWPGQTSERSMYLFPQVGLEFGDEGVDYSPQPQGASSYRMPSQEHLNFLPSNVNLPSNNLPSNVQSQPQGASSYRMPSQEHISLPWDVQPQPNQRLWNSGANTSNNSNTSMSASLHGDELASPYQPAQLRGAYGNQFFALRPAPHANHSMNQTIDQPMPHVDHGKFSSVAPSLLKSSPTRNRFLPAPSAARQSYPKSSRNFTRAGKESTSSFQQNCDGISNQDDNRSPPVSSAARQSYPTSLSSSRGTGDDFTSFFQQNCDGITNQEDNRLPPVPSVARQSFPKGSSSSSGAGENFTSSFQQNCDGITNQEDNRLPPVPSVARQSYPISLGSSRGTGEDFTSFFQQNCDGITNQEDNRLPPVISVARQSYPKSSSSSTGAGENFTSSFQQNCDGISNQEDNRSPPVSSVARQSYSMSLSSSRGTGEDFTSFFQPNCDGVSNQDDNRLPPVPSVARKSYPKSSSTSTGAGENFTSSFQQNCDGILNQEDNRSSPVSSVARQSCPISSSSSTRAAEDFNPSFQQDCEEIPTQDESPIHSDRANPLFPYPMATPNDQAAYHFPPRDSVSGRTSIDGQLSSGHIYTRPPHGDPNVVPVKKRRARTSHEGMDQRSSSTNDEVRT